MLASYYRYIVKCLNKAVYKALACSSKSWKTGSWGLYTNPVPITAQENQQQDCIILLYNIRTV